MNRRLTGALGACLLAFGSAPALMAQSEADLAKEIAALKAGQAQIRGELAEIKKLLQSRPAAAPSGPNVAGKVFDLGSNPIKGEPTAKLTLVEFLDYQ
ncbi:MAG: hypothetical protein AAF657_19500 [Acidobacteriota bacterium]